MVDIEGDLCYYRILLGATMSRHPEEGSTDQLFDGSVLGGKVRSYRLLKSTVHEVELVSGIQVSAREAEKVARYFGTADYKNADFFTPAARAVHYKFADKFRRGRGFRHHFAVGSPEAEVLALLLQAAGCFEEKENVITSFAKRVLRVRR